MSALYAEIFRALEFDSPPTLSEVVKLAGWGSNRDIRQKGFRLDSGFSDRSPYFSTTIRQMERVTDPQRIVEHENAVLTPKGRNVVVIIVKEKGVSNATK